MYCQKKRVFWNVNLTTHQKLALSSTSLRTYFSLVIFHWSYSSANCYSFKKFTRTRNYKADCDGHFKRKNLVWSEKRVFWNVNLTTHQKLALSSTSLRTYFSLVIFHWSYSSANCYSFKKFTRTRNYKADCDGHFKRKNLVWSHWLIRTREYLVSSYLVLFMVMAFIICGGS